MPLTVNWTAGTELSWLWHVAMARYAATVVQCCCKLTGFTPQLQELADQRADLLLVALADMV
jgi:hypothetical protein